MKTILFKREGAAENAQVKARYEFVGGSLWLYVDGKTYCFESEQRRRGQRKKGPQTEPGVARALMPGKILKILVSEGDSVTVGQELVAMEAMKMEYILKSDIDGTVESIGCKVSEQVASGQVLVKVVES